MSHPYLRQRSVRPGRPASEVGFGPKLLGELDLMHSAVMMLVRRSCEMSFKKQNAPIRSGRICLRE